MSVTVFLTVIMRLCSVECDILLRILHNYTTAINVVKFKTCFKKLN